MMDRILPNRGVVDWAYCDLMPRLSIELGIAETSASDAVWSVGRWRIDGL